RRCTQPGSPPTRKRRRSFVHPHPELSSPTSVSRRASPALAASAAVGAALTIGADVVGQHALGPVTAPVGVVTGLVGAPYLLLLLARSEREGR
ncbi:iron chelate uptake ABC transporter family permease subunit, partial [Nocardioides sp. YIM 152588]|uniref:iron chelate uptake ABC transporter family permease subunit n=1 Tax=Nocardioides sp. YIM 152588 TaxID=3158259 RepID=UPI0032E3AE18